MEAQHEAAVFGGGCFWCTEAVFAALRGVKSVMPGYAGGHTENPSYRQVCSGSTGHAEVTRVVFDPAEISYRDLLEVFFASHDPTTLNQQGADRGTQYRSVILYADDGQKEEANAYIKELDSARIWRSPLVTEVAPLDRFYDAEAEHQAFYERNSSSMYCQIVIDPKLAKVREKFAQQVR